MSSHYSAPRSNVASVWRSARNPFNLLIAVCLLAASAEAADQTPERVILQPDWLHVPTTAPIDAVDAGNIRAISDKLEKAGAQNVKLPILLPPVDPEIAKLRFSGTEYEYSASMQVDNTWIYVIGTRVAFRGPLTQQPATIGGVAPQLKHTETGFSLAFSRYNVAYVLEVACGDPKTNRNCIDESYIRALYSRLRVVSP